MNYRAYYRLYKLIYAQIFSKMLLLPHNIQLDYNAMHNSLELDDRDHQILRTLQRDGRISNADLASLVNLSPSACLRRVKRLEDIGVIDRYVALLSRSRLGRNGTAFLLIRMERQSKDTFKEFEAAVMAIPEVLEVHLIAGDADYMIKLAYTDADDFERLYFHRVMALPGVVGTQTKLSLRTVYSSTELQTANS